MLNDPGVRRHFLMIFLPLAFLLIAITGTVGFFLDQSALDRVKGDDRALVQLGAKDLAGQIAPPLRHIRSLPIEAEVREGVDNPTPANLEQLAASLITLLQRNPAYDKARWIDETGRERVRIEQVGIGKAPVIGTPDKLQDKSEIYYFGAAMALAPGEIYVSALDLTIDNGVTAFPKKPTWRVATPVQDRNGVKRGIVVINMLMEPVLEQFSRVGGSRMMLLNKRGEFLYGPGANGQWETMVESSQTMGEHSSEIWNHVQAVRAGQLINSEGLWTWETLTPENIAILLPNANDEPHWVIVTLRPAAFIRSMSLQTWVPAIVIASVLLAIFCAMCWHIAVRSRARLDAIADAARAEASAEAQRQQISILERNAEQLATLAAIVSSSDDAIISKTLKGVVTSWNPGAEKLFGYTKDEAVGQSMLMLFPAGLEGEEAEILAKIARGETVRHFVTRRMHKDGHLIDVSVTISPIHDSSGNIVGASKIARDISKWKQINEELQRHRDNLEKMVRDRTDQLLAANEQLADQKQFVTTITDNIPGLVAYWDKSLHLRFANQAYRDWLSIADGDISHISMDNLLQGDLLERNRPRLEGALAGVAQYFEQEIKRPDTSGVYCQTHYIPDVKDGEVIGFFVLITDVTAIKQAELDLRQVNEKLEGSLAATKAADVAKSQFLANMSHEIRTPMNAVLGFLGLVLERELPDVTRRQLSTAYNSAKSLLLLINDILDISKLQSGKIELESVPFDLSDVLRETLDMMQIKVRDKKLELQMQYDDDAPRRFIGDPMRIRQIVTNLLGNAIKFTENGWIKLRVAAPSDEQSGMIELSVADTGIGMTPEQMNRIFTPFVQADSSTTRKFGGTGLGTSICKQLAKAMGGMIRVESQVGVGTRFSVLLPLQVLPHDVILASHDLVGEAEVHSNRRFDILLVDDVEENVELGQARLTGQGHKVTVAHNGHAAVQLATSQDFDLILMDVHMPGLNGLDATREIRILQKDNPYHIPIIALTASVLPAEQKLCFDAGMDAFIGKPIDFGELFRLMEKTVPADRGELNTAPLAQTQATNRFQPILAGIDWADGIRRWNDTDRYAMALSRYHDKFGDAAVRLRSQLVAGNWNSAYELSHALKGVASNLAITDVARIAGALSESFRNRREHDIDGLLEELGAANTQAAESIALMLLNHHPSNAHPADGSVVPVSEVSAGDLLKALDSDDPDEIEPLLDRLSRSVPDDILLNLRRLIEDFEFDEARTILKKLVETKKEEVT